MLVGAAQPPLVGLAVHRDQLLGQLAEHPDRRGPAADVGPRAPVGRHRAHEDEPVLDVGAGLGRAREGGVARGRSTHALDDGAVGAGAHEPGVAAPTEQQARPVTTIVLPAPVSPVTTVSPGERQRGVVDHAEVPDPDLLDHVAAVPVGAACSRRAAPRHPAPAAGTSRRAGR